MSPEHERLFHSRSAAPLFSGLLPGLPSERRAAEGGEIERRCHLRVGQIRVLEAGYLAEARPCPLFRCRLQLDDHHF